MKALSSSLSSLQPESDLGSPSPSPPGWKGAHMGWQG